MKLFLQEDGSEDAITVWERSPIATTSWITYPETSAALAAACRTGRLNAEGHRLAIQHLAETYTEIALIRVDGSVGRSAGTLAERHGLQGMDAIHLATALRFAADEVIVLTYDAELARAARAEGLATAGVRAAAQPPG